MRTFAERIYTPTGITTENIFTNDEKVLHVGSGSRALTGATTVDKLNVRGVDTVHDLNSFPWPYDSDSFDLVYAHNVFEHLEDMVGVMEEVWRVLKPKGRVVITVPYFRSVDAFGDLTHRHFFTSRSMIFCIDEGTGQAKYQYTQKLFSQVGFWYGWPHEPKNFLRRFLKRFIHAHSSLYDSHISLLLPTEIVIWELEKISSS